MTKSLRLIAAMPAALIATTGLFGVMVVMISKDWVPSKVATETSFEVNPKIIDLPTFIPEAAITPIKKVETPPPPPQIERVKGTVPSEPIATILGAVPEIHIPPIQSASFPISVSDRRAQPIHRPDPIIPPRFLQGNHSGHCLVHFDVSAEGAPYNVETTYCTDSLLERATIKSVQTWKFTPKIVDGRAVTMTGVENKVAYRLTDMRGEVLPEPL